MTIHTITFDDEQWQVVPKNPVPAMIESGANEVIAPLPTAGAKAGAVYIAMLAAAPEPPAQDPTINVVFRCEDDGVVGTTSHQPIHSVRQEDDGSFTVALDYWPTPTRQPTEGPLTLVLDELQRAINALGIDSRAGTPDYVLADAIWAYLHGTPAKSLPAQPRRPYGTDTVIEHGVIPECDGPKPPAQEPMTVEQIGQSLRESILNLKACPESPATLGAISALEFQLEKIFHGIGEGESNEG